MSALAFMSKRLGFPKGANPQKHEDTTNLPDCEGWLKKLSSKGIWQSRYFVLHNTFLNYYGSASKAVLLASIDLSKVRGCRPDGA